MTTEELITILVERYRLVYGYDNPAVLHHLRADVKKYMLAEFEVKR